MIKLIFLVIFLFVGSHPLKADEAITDDQEFMRQLDIVKDPFEDGLPKPIPIIVPPPVVHHEEQKVVPKPKEIVPVITLPLLKIQGVIVGEDIHEVIIDDQVVPLQGAIEGAQVISVSKTGVGLLYKGKKFFIKVD